jgi:hypothetical protein
VSRFLSVTFRGSVADIVVDRYIPDPDTNSCEIEWHFVGLSFEDHDALNVLDDEEDAVHEQIHEAMAEGDD